MSSCHCLPRIFFFFHFCIYLIVNIIDKQVLKEAKTSCYLDAQIIKIQWLSWNQSRICILYSCVKQSNIMYKMSFWNITCLIATLFHVNLLTKLQNMVYDVNPMWNSLQNYEILFMMSNSCRSYKTMKHGLWCQPHVDLLTKLWKLMTSKQGIAITHHFYSLQENSLSQCISCAASRIIWILILSHQPYSSNVVPLGYFFLFIILKKK